jgi:DNA-binding transcriptional ArsR family regulator
MSRNSAAAVRKLRAAVPLFAALGDETRIELLLQLASEGPESITQLSANHDQTRQAVTKHLTVLESAGLVTGERRGRERVWRIEAARLDEARKYLELISAQWDDALERLRDFVEV